MAFFVKKNKPDMRKEKSFPVLSVVILVVFGVLCFWGGFLSSNIANKRKLDALRARLSECENKFILFSRQVIGNADAAVKISEGVSSIWHDSVKNGTDFNDGMEKFLEENKDAIADMKLKNDLIDIQISDLKKYTSESKDTFIVVMELYDVYKKIYALGMNPAGTLEGFDSNRQTLIDAYEQVQSKLIAYMPGVTEMPQPESVAAETEPRSVVKEARRLKAPVVNAAQPLQSASSEQLNFDQRVKKIAANMTYRQVESAAGVPRDKQKNSEGCEVWIYPSEKTGFRNVVYFSSGKVLQTKNLPLNGSLE